MGGLKPLPGTIGATVEHWFKWAMDILNPTGQDEGMEGHPASKLSDEVVNFVAERAANSAEAMYALTVAQVACIMRMEEEQGLDKTDPLSNELNEIRKLKILNNDDLLRVWFEFIETEDWQSKVIWGNALRAELTARKLPIIENTDTL